MDKLSGLEEHAAVGGLSFRLARTDDLPKLVRMLADDTLGAQREVVSSPPVICYVEAFEANRGRPEQRAGRCSDR